MGIALPRWMIQGGSSYVVRQRADAATPLRWPRSSRCRRNDTHGCVRTGQVLAFYLVLLVLIVVGVFHWWRRSRKYAPDDMLRNNVDQLKYRILYGAR